MSTRFTHTSCRGGGRRCDAALTTCRSHSTSGFRWSLGICCFWTEAVCARSAKGEDWNRGAYLARGLAHCGACHTPRNLLMAEASREYGGGEVAVARPKHHLDATSGIGGWSNDELIAYLRLGRAANKAQAAGPMAEAIDHSLRHLTEGDLRAIVVYLKSVPAIRDPTTSALRLGDPRRVGTVRGVVFPDDLNRMTGAQLYDAWCATCHQARGQGSFDGGLPPLFHNTALGSANTNNLVAVMLDGIVRQSESAEAAVLMPGFTQLSDRQLATLSSWLTNHYGNPAASVTADQVRRLRNGPGDYLVVAVRVAMVVALLLIAWVVLAVVRRQRRKVDR